mmetsp:Transcript_11855/g.47821  ORF Transcript_11855/g.47821 Transcript_11855/m.47821 type:complete len:277 (+) Transcript_11855:370-1200(+)
MFTLTKRCMTYSPLHGVSSASGHAAYMTPIDCQLPKSTAANRGVLPSRSTCSHEFFGILSASSRVRGLSSATSCGQEASAPALPSSSSRLSSVMSKSISRSSAEPLLIAASQQRRNSLRKSTANCAFSSSLIAHNPASAMGTTRVAAVSSFPPDSLSSSASASPSPPAPLSSWGSSSLRGRILLATLSIQGSILLPSSLCLPNGLHAAVSRRDFSPFGHAFTMYLADVRRNSSFTSDRVPALAAPLNAEPLPSSSRRLVSSGKSSMAASIGAACWR